MRQSVFSRGHGARNIFSSLRLSANSSSGACTAEFVYSQRGGQRVKTRATLPASAIRNRVESGPSPLFRHEHPGSSPSRQFLDGFRRKFFSFSIP